MPVRSLMSTIRVPVAFLHVMAIFQDSEKLRKIRSIWGSDRGVVSLHVYNNSIAEEAFTREAVMISCIG